MVGLKKVPSVSSKLAIAGTTVFEKAVHLAGKTTDINPLTMIMLSRPSADYSNTKAKKLLGYKPTVTLDKGMQRCETWLREQGIITSIRNRKSRKLESMIALYKSYTAKYSIIEVDRGWNPFQGASQ